MRFLPSPKSNSNRKYDIKNKPCIMTRYQKDGRYVRERGRKRESEREKDITVIPDFLLVKKTNKQKTGKLVTNRPMRTCSVGNNGRAKQV